MLHVKRRLVRACVAVSLGPASLSRSARARPFHFGACGLVRPHSARFRAAHPAAPVDVFGAAPVDVFGAAPVDVFGAAPFHHARCDKRNLDCPLKNRFRR